MLLLSGCGCKGPDPHQYDITLEVWGPQDDSYTYLDIFDTYKKINPNIQNIVYKKLTIDTYKQELLEALASGQGPDVFLIHNTWLPGFSDKILPAPVSVFGEQQFRNNFVDVAANDFLSQGSVWAAPLSVDSLGLYYNKDLFNEAGITAPPADWDEFVKDVQILTKINNFGEIVQSAAAIGTAENINRSPNLISLLFMQSGLDMVDKNGRAGFSNPKGENALNFYTQFSKSGSPYYTWNRNMHYSIDAFSEGNLAMMFNYSWHISTITGKSPKLNFAVASIPQFSNSPQVNYANYWGFAVAKNKSVPSSLNQDIRVAESWKLVNFLTVKPEKPLEAQGGGLAVGGAGVDPNFDPAFNYVTKTRRPAARRDIIEMQKNDPWLGAFAKGNLIAKSWRQNDPDAVEGVLMEMIENVNMGRSTIREALESAVKRISY